MTTQVCKKLLSLRVDKTAINNRTTDFIVGLNEMGVVSNDDSKLNVYANGCLPIKDYIQKIWSILNSKSDHEDENGNTTVTLEHNVTLEQWSKFLVNHFFYTHISLDLLLPTTFILCY